MRTVLSTTAMIAMLMLATACFGEAPGLRRVTFAPQWLPQAQFAGYYVALEHGLYAEQGLDVTLLPGGPENPPSRMLADGRADVASLWLSTAIQKRDQGVRLVNVAQMLGRSSLLLVAKKSSGIRAPADLKGRRVGVWQGDFLLEPLGFLHRYELDAELVPLGASVNLFLRDGVEAMVAMRFNQYHTILNSGLEPSELITFPLREHGLDFPEDGLYCLEDTLSRDPALCRDFVRASMAGWDWAFAHPDEAVQLTMEYMLRAHVSADAAHQRWMLDRIREVMRPVEGAPPLPGVLRPEDYARTAQALKADGAIREVPPFRDFHRTMVALP